MPTIPIVISRRPSASKRAIAPISARACVASWPSIASVTEARKKAAERNMARSGRGSAASATPNGADTARRRASAERVSSRVRASVTPGGVRSSRRACPPRRRRCSALQTCRLAPLSRRSPRLLRGSEARPRLRASWSGSLRSPNRSLVESVRSRTNRRRVSRSEHDFTGFFRACLLSNRHKYAFVGSPRLTVCARAWYHPGVESSADYTFTTSASRGRFFMQEGVR